MWEFVFFPLFFLLKPFIRRLFFLFFFFLSDVLSKVNKKSLLFGAQDVQIEREKQIYSVTGGCTALTVVYLLGKLYVANAGDSRCVLRPSSEQTQTIAPVCFKNNFLPFLEARSASSGSCLISYCNVSAGPSSSETTRSSPCRRSSRQNQNDSDFSSW